MSVGLHKGTLIADLIASVEEAERLVASRHEPAAERERPNLYSFAPCAEKVLRLPRESEPEQLPQPFGLSPADRYLALLLIIHAQLIRTLEPRYDLADTVDIHQIGAVGPPEHPRVEAVK